jgi:hypothetical protein
VKTSVPVSLDATALADLTHPEAPQNKIEPRQSNAEFGAQDLPRVSDSLEGECHR